LFIYHGSSDIYFLKSIQDGLLPHFHEKFSGMGDYGIGIQDFFPLTAGSK